ncbi:MAG: hypothetical protein ABH879_03230 [archaeon]
MGQKGLAARVLRPWLHCRINGAIHTFSVPIEPIDKPEIFQTVLHDAGDNSLKEVERV